MDDVLDGKRILIVDDEPDVPKGSSLLLTLMGVCSKNFRKSQTIGYSHANALH